MTRNSERPTILERGLLLAVVLLVATIARAADEDPADNVFLPVDRHTLQELANSRKLLAEGRYGEAVRCLGDILAGPEDFLFQPDKNSPVHRSLKAETQRLIGQLPREGRELYELQYGAQARRMLQEALSSGNVATLAEASRQFFHTRSGYQATFLLGLDHFDHGRPLAAALTLQRLQEAGTPAEEMEPALSLTTATAWLQAGSPEKARETLVSLRRRHPSLRVAVAGREVPIFNNDAEAVDWLVGLIGPPSAAAPAEADRWLIFRGDAARNAASAGSAPLMSVRWRVKAAEDPAMEAALDRDQRQLGEQGVPAIPALHPLAAADVLLMRTTRNLLAVDFASGKRLWETPAADDDSASDASAEEVEMSQSSRLMGIEQRMWSDMTYGTLSSDGRRVFAIEDLELGVGQGGGAVFRIGFGFGRRVRFVGPVTSDEQTLCNRLAALDIHTGKLVWQLGGQAGLYALRQAETFFLGPPLPLLGQLYVLGETKGEIRLLALDAATGNLLWSQQLAVAEQSVADDPLRRLAGMSPSYADGVLVCPTSTGAIVGVDLATRSLLWGYCYVRGRSANRGNFIMPFANGGAGHWVDGSVSIADGRVLATPFESDWLYCINLADGDLLWKSPRKNNLYVACADREKVVLVGPREVQALRMADGKPAWGGRAIDLPENSTPSGRGFLAGDRYFLPLSNAEVAAIDTGKGKIVGTAKSQKGDIPGNLVCHGGRIISQGLGGVDTYYQLDSMEAEAQRRLAANANDAEALSLRGEILLDAGKRSEAVAAFRRAYQLQPRPRTRQLLRDSLLEGLRTEFAAYRDQGDEVERLADDTAQLASYFRLMADGFRRTDQWIPALEYCLKLIDLEPLQRPLDPIDKTLAARRDRWFQGELALLRREAGAEAAAKIDAVVATRLKTAVAANSIDPLQRFLDDFGGQPAAAPARNVLARQLKGAGRLLDAELVEGYDAHAARPPAAAPKNPGQPRAAVPQAGIEWPMGEVKIKSTKSAPPTVNMYGRYAIEVRDGGKPFLSDLSLHFDENRQILSGSDGWGRQQWQLSLAGEGPRRQNFGYNRLSPNARTVGHLLVVATGSKVMAIDMLGARHNGTPRLLWAQDTTTPPTEAANPLALINLPRPFQVFASPAGKMNLLGPVTNQFVCFQRGRDLVAVDPRNGETLWVRQDVSPGSDVFGDEQYLFVLPSDREPAMVLRATDGQLVETRLVPRLSHRQALRSGGIKRFYSRLEEFCLTTLGRRMLLWWPEGNHRVLTLVDPWEGRDLWPSRTFSNAARACVLGDDAVGVMEPDGEFVLLGLPDGRTIAELKLNAEPTLTDITLLGGGSHYFLLAQTAAQSRGRALPMQPMPGGAVKPIYSGHLYAINDQGKLQWPASVAIENQFLLADQPARLPVLTFACQVFQQLANGQGRMKVSLLLIDKRDGRAAFKAELANVAGFLDIVGDADKKTIDLIMPRDTIKLTFTDKPLPPPSSVDKSPPSPPETSPAHAFWNSMRGGLDRLIGGANEK